MALTIQHMIFGLYTWALLSTALVVMLAMFTPAFTFLRARMSKNKAVMVVLHTSNRVSFVVGEFQGGSWHTKKHGMFDETANSAHIAYKTMLYFCPEKYAHTLTTKYQMVIQSLRKLGYRFFNYAEYVKLSNELAKKEKSITLASGETLRMGDNLNMFPAIDDPSIREREKEASINLHELQKKQDLKKWIVLILIGGLVAFILWSIFKGQPGPAVEVVCKYPELLNAGAGGNLTI